MKDFFKNVKTSVIGSSPGGLYTPEERPPAAAHAEAAKSRHDALMAKVDPYSVSGGYLFPAQMGSAAQGTISSNILSRSYHPDKVSTRTTVHIQKVANGNLVILGDLSGYGPDWSRAWIVPDGESVTDVIAQAMAVERLTGS